MPVALIVFGDKSHTDLHGMLALTPVIFTLTLFNQSAQNNQNHAISRLWRKRRSIRILYVEGYYEDEN